MTCPEFGTLALDTFGAPHVEPTDNNEPKPPPDPLAAGPQKGGHTKELRRRPMLDRTSVAVAVPVVEERRTWDQATLCMPGGSGCGLKPPAIALQLLALDFLVDWLNAFGLLNRLRIFFHVCTTSCY